MQSGLKGRIKIDTEKVRLIKAEASRNASDFVEDFKEFAFKGNVIDLAVGVIIGGGFNKIVQSLTNDIIMPIFGKILGNAAFTDLYINLSDKQYSNLADATADGAPIIRYGLFINSIIDFLIIALTLFIVLKFVLRKKKEEEVKEIKEEIKEIEKEEGIRK